MMPNIDALERQKIIAARINEGRDSYAGRLDAWHKLGAVSGEFQTWKDMIAAAKADFQVVKQQLFFCGKPVDAWGTFRVDEAPIKGAELTAIPLEIDGANGKQTVFLTFLGAVGKDYTVIQHTTGFELLDHLVGEIDGAHYETMGTLDFGRVVFGQVDPNVSIRVGSDVSDIFLSFLTSHDGSKAYDLYETATRQVCRNTVRIGSLKRLAATLRVRHTRNAQKRIDNLKQEIDEIRSVAMTMQERLTFLSQRQVTRESFTTIFDRLFPKTKNDDGVEESSKRRENILASVLSLYESNDHDAFPEQRGTAYSLLNSITNFVDHERSSKGDGRAESAIFGSGDKLKTSALDLILGEAEKMPLIRGAQKGIMVDFAEIGLNVPGAVKN